MFTVNVVATSQQQFVEVTFAFTIAAAKCEHTFIDVYGSQAKRNVHILVMSGVEQWGLKFIFRGGEPGRMQVKFTERLRKV